MLLYRIHGMGPVADFMHSSWIKDNMSSLRVVKNTSGIQHCNTEQKNAKYAMKIPSEFGMQ